MCIIKIIYQTQLLVLQSSFNLLMISQIDGAKFYKANSYCFYGLTTLVILFLLAIQWYLAASVIFIKTIVTIRREKIAQQSKQARKVIENYPWHELHRNVRDSLELIKYSKMIERGYDSKTNTNIILHEEKQLSSIFQYSKEQETIINSCIIIMKVLQKICQTKRSIFKGQPQSNDIECIGKIISFKELFAANRATDLFITQLWELSGLVRTHMEQPLLDQYLRYELLRECKSGILPLLQKLTKENLNLEQNRRNCLLAFKVKPQYQQYLDLFTSINYKEKKLEALMRKIQQLERQTKITQLQKPMDNNYTILQSESKQQKPIRVQHDPQTEQLSTDKRKEFMRKLDAQLMMGLARRRQQEYERRMKLLEQQDPTAK